MTARISTLSKEYVRVQVEAKEAGVLVNPTALVVKMAFVADNSAKPAAGDWKTAAWETEPGPVYYARIVIGPGSSPLIELKPGTYQVWVQITDSPEIPARPAGSLVVF